MNEMTARDESALRRPVVVVADSGATKTDWLAGRAGETPRAVRTGGINPFHHSPEEIEETTGQALLGSGKWTAAADEVHFYGAGCTPEKAAVVERALRKCFPRAEVSVESDLLGAARALCGHEAGIACILGTGSNSCVYDGTRVTAHIPPLGYLLGDEGSGAALGKRLVADCLKGRLSAGLCRELLDEYDLTPALILDRTYREPRPARFLAGFAPFLSVRRERPEIHALLLNCFDEFFVRNVLPYPRTAETRVHFAGSVAFYFRAEVEEAARARGLVTGRFLKSPATGLAAYHGLRPPED